MNRRSFRTGTVAALVAALLAACSHAGIRPSTSASAKPSAATLKPLIRPSSAAEVNAQFASGEDIFITGNRLVPTDLVAAVGYDIIFHNTTSHPVKVRSTNLALFGFSSPAIPPGGTFIYHPKGPYSILYRATPPGTEGHIQAAFPMAPYASATPTTMASP